jgi:hypothetical protein
MFGGLRHWVDAGWVHGSYENSDGKEFDIEPPAQEIWVTRRRPVLKVLAIMATTHTTGALFFLVVTRPWFLTHRMVFIAHCSSFSIGSHIDTVFFDSTLDHSLYPASGKPHPPFASYQRCSSFTSIEGINFMFSIYGHLHHNGSQLFPCGNSCSYSRSSLVSGIIQSGVAY